MMEVSTNRKVRIQTPAIEGFLFAVPGSMTPLLRPAPAHFRTNQGTTKAPGPGMPTENTTLF